MKFRQGCNWKLCYSEYLKTPHWLAKKAETTAFYGGLCAICGDIGSEVHHTPKGYEFLFEEVVGIHVVYLCDYHHAKQHNKSASEEFLNNPDKVWEQMQSANDTIKHESRTIPLSPETITNPPIERGNGNAPFGYVEAF